MKQVLFICLLLFIVSLNISAQTKVKRSTLEIFDKSISGEFEKLFFLPGVDRKEKFIFYGSLFDANTRKARFVLSILKKTADKLNINYSVAGETHQSFSDSSYNKFSVIVNDIKTTYPKFIKNKFLGEKTIERKLSAEIVVSITTSDGKSIPDETINIDYSDEIELDNYETYETDEYSFTKAVPPKESTFESLFFPVILVTVSAAATILFFTIRTK